jgi:glyceraldehyde 3-phosphate dehydrogenase
MAVRIGINGFGRIGRLVFKAAMREKAVEVVGVNDITDASTLAYLLKYDSVHGLFPATVETSEKGLLVNNRKIPVFAEKDPADLPWKDLGVDVVVESTGVFRKRDQVARHLDAGAQKVLLSVPAKDEIDATIVLGVNDHDLKPGHLIVSNASCTTNCLAPPVKVLHDVFGIRLGLMTTIHAYTNDQKILDAPHKDLRRARAAAVSMIPTTTGAAKAVGKVIPELDGKLNGMAVRVPTPDGSMVDLVFQTEKPVSVDSINQAMEERARGSLKGILEYCKDPIVSVDVIGNSHSSVFDSQATMVMGGHMAKIIAWYDNEWGYSCRMVDLLVKMASF